MWPRAVFVSSDIQAIGAMQAIREQGLRIPQDVVVVGFDDIELARHKALNENALSFREEYFVACDFADEDNGKIFSPEFFSVELANIERY